MKVAEYVAKYARDLGIRHVFGVTGGGSMYLNDAFRDLFVANHHEQASAFAADAYARLNGMGCALVTTGPGGTNALTGVAASWVDSVPVLYLSGQVTRATMSAGTGLRQYGVQETNILDLVRPITKYADVVSHPKRIRFHLDLACAMARSGRPGPVWLDIPLDVQNAEVNEVDLQGYTPPHPKRANLSYHMGVLSAMLEQAARPVFVVGNGARSEVLRVRDLSRRWGVPVVTSWGAADLWDDADPYRVGRFGIFGDRAANFAVQNADLLIVLGCRLAVPHIGHDHKAFAPDAKLVMVDTDEAELFKDTLNVQLPVHADIAEFAWAAQALHPTATYTPWLIRCQKWRDAYGMHSEYREPTPGLTNSFDFASELSESLPSDAIVVTDMGSAFTSTFQAARIRLGQRWFTAYGHAPMGYALPAAIGAHYATGKRVTAIVGDGAMMFNLQELQTIGENRLPIDIFVLDNGGYLTMKHTQENHFHRKVGSEFRFPDWPTLAAQFGVSIVSVKMDPMQPLTPRVQTVVEADGTFRAGRLHDMYPYLPRYELAAIMGETPEAA